MKQEHDTPIHLIKGLDHASHGDNAHALLHEIVKLLQQLLEADEPSHIDLQAIPLGQEDMEMLASALGEGEVSAEVIDFGITQVRATGIPGVWWVVQMDESGQLIGEFIEINYCPEALIVVTEDIREGREALRARLFEADMRRKRRTPGTNSTQ